VGRDFCDQLMDLDDSFGIKAAFQIVPQRRYEVCDSFLQRIRSRGFEVNVHDLNHDGRLYLSREEFRRRAVLINSYAKKFGSRGFRAGAMYRQQAWYDALEFSYDMSVPNGGHLEPQRGGCCTVMPYFVGRVLELPLTTTEDYSLFHMMGDYSLDVWKKQIEMIRHRHGLISILTHPDYVIEPRAQRVFRDLLEQLSRLRSEAGVWTTLPRDVDAWWRSRSQMTLVRDGGSWRIEGRDSDRAEVAFARLEGGHLIYRRHRPN
jgi:hypothetical protein